ncbi:MAG TPA: amidohydrolase family protein, partial [Candidatus Polarisedimenticolaceae bacterium]|nr:amidohydrolase family protein [Candidatus Polarisedimenticolaceae bacterium]
HAGVVGLPRIVDLLSVAPARILRLDRGTLRPGAAADVTVLDLDRTTVVDPARFASRSANTPFAGWTLRGAAVMTIVGGRIVHDAR